MKTKYPFAELEVGQSCLIESTRNRVAAAVSTYGKKTGKKFKTSMSENLVKVERIEIKLDEPTP